MKVYAPAEAIAAPCPSCKAPAGVWCSANRLGPMVCERRARLIDRHAPATPTTEEDR